jgi:hypothetical protein
MLSVVMLLTLMLGFFNLSVLLLSVDTLNVVYADGAFLLLCGVLLSVVMSYVVVLIVTAPHF